MTEQLMGKIEFRNWDSIEQVKESKFWHKRTQATYLIKSRLWTWNVSAEQWQLY